MQIFTDILTLISNCIFNYKELIPGDINDDIYVLKENITDQEACRMTAHAAKAANSYQCLQLYFVISLSFSLLREMFLHR